AFGEHGFRGTDSGQPGPSSEMIAFRIRAVVADIRATSTDGSVDVPLMDNLARLVEHRIQSDPVAEAHAVGWPMEPVQVPGKDPVVESGVWPGTVVPPGAEVTGSSSGSPVPGDTIVLLTVTGLERPWNGGGSLPRPANGMEYLTVET